MLHTTFRQRISNPRRLRNMKIRHQVENLIREFFFEQNFLETRTPLLVKSPGMEPHIRPFKLKSGAYLPTSPEFAMKKLLVGGLVKIFQICPAFRDEPRSPHHHPEFMILEWYRAQAGYKEIMEDTENLVAFMAQKLFQKASLSYQENEISVKPPWPRFKIRDLFMLHTGVELTQTQTLAKMQKSCKKLRLPVSPKDTWDDLYFKIWLNLIEPKLPKDRAIFVIDYPTSQAALSVLKKEPDGSTWAKRFEFYIGGLELGNAFEELTDPVEQKKRFIHDMALRKKIYGRSFPSNPIDDEFLAALTEGLPPSGGIAVGVDRLVMLFANETDIDYTVWLPSYTQPCRLNNF